MPEISVIIPVYQAEKTLGTAIESIQHQTFQDWELLLIDDGSKDNSGAIADRYAAEDRRIRVFHRANAGVSRPERGSGERQGRLVRLSGRRRQL